MNISKYELIEKLIEDKISNKLNWYKKDYYFYCTIRKIQKTDIIDTIFKLIETVEDDVMDMMSYTEFSLEDEYSIKLDIYLRKNKKKESFCVRIDDHQLKLLELLEAVMKVKKQLPVK